MDGEATLARNDKTCQQLVKGGVSVNIAQMSIPNDDRRRLRVLLLRGMHAYEERVGDDSEVFNPDDDVWLDDIIDAWLAKTGPLIGGRV